MAFAKRDIRGEDGAIVDAVPGEIDDSPPAAEIVGSEDRWLRALIDFRPIGLSYGGDPLFGHRMIECSPEPCSVPHSRALG